MLDKKEKMVMGYLFDTCGAGQTHLFSAQEIIDFVASKKHILSIRELEDIMVVLAKEDMIDYVQSESKGGTMYCIGLKNKGNVFRRDLQKEKRYASWVILRTALLAIFSFIIGLLLRAIF